MPLRDESRVKNEKSTEYTAVLPNHSRVYEILRQHINEGVYTEGDLLPSENELCALHKVTRPTIRKALPFPWCLKVSSSGTRGKAAS